MGILRAGAVCMGLAVGTVANAMPILEFQLDAANSSVTLTNTFTGGACDFTNCGVSAELAAGFGATPFSIGTGQTFNFDFLTFTGAGLGTATYDIEATLAFLSPADATTTGNGTAGGLILFGNITLGVLNWTNLPTTIALAQGSTIQVDFQEGLTLLNGSTVTTGASVFGENIVPIPATLLLLGLGSAGLIAGMRRRRQAVAA